jgi:hypothetical protein
MHSWQKSLPPLILVGIVVFYLFDIYLYANDVVLVYQPVAAE